MIKRTREELGFKRLGFKQEDSHKVALEKLLGDTMRLKQGCGA